MTSTLFPDENDTEVYFFTAGSKALIKSLIKYEIIKEGIKMKFKKVLGFIMLFSLALSATACTKNSEKDDVQSLSATPLNFENGDLAGWTLEGNAFQRAGVVNEDVVEGYSAGKAGDYFFNGLEAGPQAFTGSMKSENFKIDGTGSIAFLLGAGKDNEKCYVAVYDADSNDELSRQANTDFDSTFVTTQMIRYTMDLSQYIGKSVYIKVVDEDKGDSFAYVIVDDFVTFIKDETELTNYQNERTQKLTSLLPAPFVEDETLTIIQNPGFDEPDLSGWKILSGTAFNTAASVGSTDKFWDTRDFNAIGEKFLNGYNNDESAVGELRCSKFTLAGDGYISFLIGGAGSQNCYVTINDGNDDSELIKITNDSFKDPEMSLNLSRVYVDASNYIGKVLYIKITDNAPSGPFGSITVDDFHVSMTKADVQAVMLETYNWALTLGDDTISAYTKNYYMTFTYPFELPILRVSQKAVGQAINTSDSVDINSFMVNVKGAKTSDAVVSTGIESVVFGDKTITDQFDKVDLSQEDEYTVKYYVECDGERVTDSFIVSAVNKDNIMNGSFESGNLAGWTVLTPDTLKSDSAISSDSIYWGEGIPFNNRGTYHFNGWGAQINEADAYAIRSSNFKLGKSGFISWKMGGNAAVAKVFKADGTLIATYLNTAFADVNFPNLDEGCRLATMTTFVADLSSYKNEELYIELHDIGEGPWAAVFFDEVVVRYDTAPDVAAMSDLVIFNKKIEETMTPTEFNIPWIMAEKLKEN